MHILHSVFRTKRGIHVLRLAWHTYVGVKDNMTPFGEMIGATKLFAWAMIMRKM
jgi:hypothetical protein